MAKLHGRFGSLFISDDAGATFVEFEEAMDIDADNNLDEIETTTKNSGDVREYIRGRRDLTFGVTALWNETDPGQIKVRASFYGGPNVLTRFRLQDGTGFLEWLDLESFITAYAPGAPNDDASTLDVTFRVTGQHTPSAQP